MRVLAIMDPETLEDLLEQERAVSRTRRQLHRRIEYLQGTGAHELGAAALVAGLVAEERELSTRRRELHEAIDALGLDGGGAHTPR